MYGAALVFLSLSWQNRQYRFAKRRSLFAEHILQDGQLRVQAAARWFVSEFLALRAELGVIAYRELELFDPRGNDFVKRRYRVARPDLARVDP